MKKICVWIAAACFIWTAACHKGDSFSSGATSVSGDSLSYNTVTGTFSPHPEITGHITAYEGIEQIYYYLQRTGVSDSLVYIDTTFTKGAKTADFTIPAKVFKQVDLSTATGLKAVIAMADNRSFSGVVKITTFTPPLPVLTDFPDTLKPDLSGGATAVNGKISAESGLDKILIEDDYQGSFVPVDSITDLKGQKNYTLDYSYLYRKNATHLRITATDIYGLTATVELFMPVLSYTILKDVTMMAQGTSASSATSCFFMEDGSLAGSCAITGAEKQLDFLIYCSAAQVLSFYSPSNSTGVAKNYKCSGVSWPQVVSDLKDTKFKVLVPGTKATDAVYAAYNANNIGALDDDFFAGISAPGSHSAKYDPDEANAASSVFNTTTAYLIWAQIPQSDGSLRNALIKASSVHIVTDASAQGMSTIDFDILLQQ